MYFLLGKHVKVFGVKEKMKDKDWCGYMIGAKDNRFVSYVFQDIKEARRYRDANPSFLMINKRGKVILTSPIYNIIKVKIIKVETIIDKIKKVFKK